MVSLKLYILLRLLTIMQKKLGFSLTKKDIAAIAMFVIFISLVAYPVYRDKHGCEIARPGYKCASAKDVLVENCKFFANYSCNVSANPSLEQIVWYIKNLCKIANEHGANYDCSNPKLVCNEVLDKNVCG